MPVVLVLRARCLVGLPLTMSARLPASKVAMTMVVTMLVAAADDVAAWVARGSRPARAQNVRKDIDSGVDVGGSVVGSARFTYGRVEAAARNALVTLAEQLVSFDWVRKIK